MFILALSDTFRSNKYGKGKHVKLNMEMAKECNLISTN